VTVVVPTYNDAERLARCCRALAAQDYEGRLEVIVVDNRSTEDVARAIPAGDPRFRLIREDRRGSYAARNAGIAAATGDVLGFTDADCIPRSDWVRKAVRRLTDAAAPHAVGGAINLLFRHGDRPVTGPELYEVRHGFDQKRFVEEFGFAATANLIVSAEVIRSLGSFDADLKSGGDLDFGTRLTSSGLRLDYADDAVVDHPSRPTWKDLRLKSLRVAGGLADLMVHEPARVVLRRVGKEARSGLTIWLRVWRMEALGGPAAKVRYAAAYAYVSVLRVYVRLRSLDARRKRSSGVPSSPPPHGQVA
jgi:glycosyltransferase involved in cell wall biosynthesis